VSGSTQFVHDCNSLAGLAPKPTCRQTSVIRAVLGQRVINCVMQRALSPDTLVFAVITLYVTLASCLIYARALLEYVIFILWVRSVSKMLPSVKLAEDKVLTFLILREKF